MTLIYPIDSSFTVLKEVADSILSPVQLPANVFSKYFKYYKIFNFSNAYEESFIEYLVNELLLNCIYCIYPYSELYNIPIILESDAKIMFDCMGKDLDRTSYASNNLFDYLTLSAKFIFFSNDSSSSATCYFDRDYDLIILACNDLCYFPGNLSFEELSTGYDFMNDKDFLLNIKNSYGI